MKINVISPLYYSLLIIINNYYSYFFNHCRYSIFFGNINYIFFNIYFEFYYSLSSNNY